MSLHQQERLIGYRLVWLWFIIVQLISSLAAIVGWVVLIPFCALHAWQPAPSPFDPARQIDRWSWAPLNRIYGNPEDGVSGQRALIWQNGHRMAYAPRAGTAWRAYCWSAWRNSADGLKYAFAIDHGPYAAGSFSFLGQKWRYGFGWKPENGQDVPVLSVRSVSAGIKTAPKK